MRDTGADIISVAGRQYTAAVGSSVITTLPAAKPIAIMQTPGANVTEPYGYKYGLKVTKVVKISDASTLQAIGFLAQLGDGGSNPVTGSRSTLLYGISGSTPSINSAQIIANVINDQSVVPYPSLQPVSGGIRICLLSTNGKKAEITVGEGGSQTATNVFIDGGVGNECD